ncbi:MAG TPA: ATP-binding protein [Verrucomicrobiota bacterium]|nr:ATP-binding protein [Verrucomicrobiota bacterium]
MKKLGFFDKLLGRIDKLDAEGLQKILQRLARERVFFETLFNTIEDGIIVIDNDGKIIYFNDAIKRLIGLEPEKDIGIEIQKALPILNLETLQQDGKTNNVVRIEFEVDYPTQRTIRLYATTIEADGQDGQTTALILHDITDIKKRTVETIETERLQALTLLAGSLAHEIGNPINALSIHSQLMIKEIKKIKASLPASMIVRPGKSVAKTPIDLKRIEESLIKIEKYLNTSVNEINRLDYIITQYLQAIRPVPPKIRLGDLNIVVKDTVDLLYPEIENRKLVLRKILCPNLPLVAFDPVQIKQALINLIKNAIQAMTKGGILTIETGHTNDDVWIAISDTGGGIPVDVMNRIFEPFYTTKQQGSGLGLMIVNRIVRDHRGKIELESKVGEGTKFKIRLPLQKRLPE